MDWDTLIHWYRQTEDYQDTMRPCCIIVQICAALFTVSDGESWSKKTEEKFLQKNVTMALLPQVWEKTTFHLFATSANMFIENVQPKTFSCSLFPPPHPFHAAATEGWSCTTPARAPEDISLSETHSSWSSLETSGVSSCCALNTMCCGLIQL